MFLYKKTHKLFENVIAPSSLQDPNLRQRFEPLLGKDVCVKIMDDLKADKAISGASECASIDGFDFFEYQILVRLAETEELALTLNLRDGKNRNFLDPQIQPVSSDVFVCFVGTGNCKANIATFVTDEQKEVGKLGILSFKELMFKHGDSVLLKSGQHTLLLEECDSLATFELMQKKSNPLVYNYDRCTGKLLYISTADPMTARTGTALDLIAALKQGADLTKLAQTALNHGEHFIRWKAVETLASLSPNRVKPLLYKCLKDKHPEVREAAYETLQLNGYL